MSFGERIVQVRKEKGLSQNELAKALNATSTTLGRYERDEVKPSIEIAIKIADTLEVSLDYLAGRSENDLKDQEMMNRFNSILNLEKEDKDNILYAIDGLIKAAKLKSI